jgi:hypothetical protein
MPFDRYQPEWIEPLPLARRQSFIDITEQAIDPEAPPPEAGDLGPALDDLADRIRQARQRGASVMLAYGAHLIKNGGAPLLRGLVEAGGVTHLATQGAGIIHDWEFGHLGRSSESVEANTAAGCFGTWDETGRWINLAVLVGGCEGLGLGESVARMVAEQALVVPQPEELEQRLREAPDHEHAGAWADLLHMVRRWRLPTGPLEVPHPHRGATALEATHLARVPLTVHPGIGYDIFTNHPLFHGGAIGRGAGVDARVFAHGVLGLSGGVYLSIGSAIMSPQVFEKAMSLANHKLLRDGRRVEGHTIAVVDLQAGGDWDWSRGEPPKDNPAYYLRFCKTFYRMGGTLRYLQADNRLVLANLLHRLRKG